MLTIVVDADAPTALARGEGQQAPRYAVEVDPGAKSVKPDAIAGRERAWSKGPGTENAGPVTPRGSSA